MSGCHSLFLTQEPEKGVNFLWGRTFDLCILLNDSEYFTTYIVISWFSTKAVHCNGRSIRLFLYTPAKCKRYLVV